MQSSVVSSGYSNRSSRDSSTGGGINKTEDEEEKVVVVVVVVQDFECPYGVARCYGSFHAALDYFCLVGRNVC